MCFDMIILPLSMCFDMIILQLSMCFDKIILQLSMCFDMRIPPFSIDDVTTCQTPIPCFQVLKEENNILQVDLSKPPDSDIVDDTPVSVRDALVFFELANLESPNSLPNPRGMYIYDSI